MRIGLFGGPLYAGALFDSALFNAWGNAWGGWTAAIEWPRPGQTKTRKVVMAPLYAPTPKQWENEGDEALILCGAL